jgi:hypothetical protein
MTLHPIYVHTVLMMSEFFKRMALNWLKLCNITGEFGHHTPPDRYEHQLMEEKIKS